MPLANDTEIMTLPTLLQFPRLFRYGYYSALAAGAVVAFSPSEAGLQPDMNDKFLHASAFVLLSMAAHFAFPSRRHQDLIRSLLIYGAAIEGVQYFIPYRSASLLDLLADLGGCLIYFLLLAPIINRLWPDKPEPG